MDSSYYTYLWLRAKDGTFPAFSPYYVGKGITYRYYDKDRRGAKPPQDRSLVILRHHVTEAEAFEDEKHLIAHYGRVDNNTGCLRNRTDGGEGASGHKHDPAFVKRLKAINTGNKYCVGRKVSASSRALQSIATVNAWSDPMYRERMSAAHKGKPWSEARRAAHTARINKERLC
jgi:hypothetical protein